MSDYKDYKRKGSVSARPYVEGEDMTGVSLSDADRVTGHPKVGGMMARGEDHNDQWYINEAFFKKNYEV
jgi:hypothetical protein